VKRDRVEGEAAAGFFPLKHYTRGRLRRLSMSRVKALALAVAVLFALAGCAQMFEFNLFGTIDTPPTPTAADYEGSAGLDKLDEDLDSPAVVDALAEDPDLVDALLSQIANEFLGGDPPDHDSGSCSSPEAQQAAIVYADLALKTSEGEELVNNIVETILEGTIDSSSTVADILADIIPPEALASQATFTAMVDALLAANEVYLLLGAYVDGSTSDGVAENDLPPGSLPGDVAQKALVAYTMAVTIAEVISGIPILAPDEETKAIAELYKVATGQASDATSITPDPYASPDPGILALLDLAGVSLP
jgi:hypothetical protein